MSTKLTSKSTKCRLKSPSLRNRLHLDRLARRQMLGIDGAKKVPGSRAPFHRMFNGQSSPLSGYTSTEDPALQSRLSRSPDRTMSECLVADPMQPRILQPTVETSAINIQYLINQHIQYLLCASMSEFSLDLYKTSRVWLIGIGSESPLISCMVNYMWKGSSAQFRYSDPDIHASESIIRCPREIPCSQASSIILCGRWGF